MLVVVRIGAGQDAGDLVADHVEGLTLAWRQAVPVVAGTHGTLQVLRQLSHGFHAAVLVVAVGDGHAGSLVVGRSGITCARSCPSSQAAADWWPAWLSSAARCSRTARVPASLVM
ncbi:MAG: hypothetical protein EBY66_05145 [Candidatus Fonsibacter lacus]|nr:hypothetical protein [Candidatus Fonsibacter lacus]